MMCLTYLLIPKFEVISIKKKWLILIIIFALIGITAVNSFSTSTQDFEGLFTMDVPRGQHYSDLTWCYDNKVLGCTKQFCEDDSGCAIGENDFAVYYYDDSKLYDGQSNAADNALHILTTTFLYKAYQRDGDLRILHNDMEMRNLPEYLVGVTNEDHSKVVFVGGYDLDMLKSYANSVEFS